MIHLSRRTLLFLGVATLVILGVSMGLLPFAINVGYEGAQVGYFGIKTINPYFPQILPPEIIWKTGDPRPSYANTWNFLPHSIELDPFEQTDYWQNYIATSTWSGRFERDAFGAPRTDSVEWDKTISSTFDPITNTTTITTRHFKASVYYALVDLYWRTNVDEDFLFTERDDPWRGTVVVMHTQITDWTALPGFEGNETNFSGLLGVEVKNLGVEPGQNTCVRLNFGVGTQLPMHSSWSDLLSGAQAPNYNGGTYLNNLRTQAPSDPDQIAPLRSEALVALPFNCFGVDASRFINYQNPQVNVQLRVHILKVGSWIAIQKVIEEPEPPPGGQTGGGLFGFLDDIGKGLQTIIAGFTNLGLIFLAGLGLVIAIILLRRRR